MPMSNNRAIDKEEMYRKIMPSASQKEIKPITEGLENESVGEPRNTIEVTQTKSYVSPKSIINIAEHAVLKRREEAMIRLKCCTCDRCQKDVLALAVNKLAPKYVVIYPEEIDKELEKFHGDVVTALVSAIMIVKNHPRH